MSRVLSFVLLFDQPATSFVEHELIKYLVQESIVSPHYPLTLPTMSTMSMPVEVMIMIFKSSVSEAPTSLHSQEAPVLLTHVCREWRSLAFDIPELWTNIKLTTTDLKSPLATQTLKRYLSLSTLCPAHLSVVAVPGDDMIAVNNFARETLTAARDCSSLTSLDVSVPRYTFDSVAAPPMLLPGLGAPTTTLSPSAAPLDLPDLHTLRLHAEHFTSLAHTVSLITTPNLRALHLIRSRDAWSLADQNVLHHALQHISSTSNTLQTLELGFFLSWTPDDMSKVLKKLHSLTSLTLHEVNSTSHISIVTALQLGFSDGSLSTGQNPHLRSFSLDLTHFEATSGGWEDAQLFQECMEGLLITVVEMVLSRTRKLPDSVADAGMASRLEFFGIGPHFVRFFEQGEAVGWPVVQRSWQDLEGIANRVQRESGGDVWNSVGCGCF